MGITVSFDPDLKNLVDLAPSTEQLALGVQALRNTQTILGILSTLEQKMSDAINSLTAEVGKDAAVMSAAAAVIQAALAAEATLKDQLAKATDPADQKALADAEHTLSTARTTLQSAVDAGNVANPPAAAAPAPAAAPATTAAASPAASETHAPASAPATGS